VPDSYKLGEGVYIGPLEIQPLETIDDLSISAICRGGRSTGLGAGLAGGMPDAAGPQTRPDGRRWAWHRASAEHMRSVPRFAPVWTGVGAGIRRAVRWWSQCHRAVHRASLQKPDASAGLEALNPWNAPGVHRC
jgi:hypothetical protein